MSAAFLATADEHEPFTVKGLSVLTDPLCSFTFKALQLNLSLHGSSLTQACIPGNSLHTKHQSSIGSESEGLIFHDIIHTNQVPDVCVQVAGTDISQWAYGWFQTLFAFLYHQVVIHKATQRRKASITCKSLA